MQLESSATRVLIKLLTLACSAYFLADGATQWVAANWLPRRAVRAARHAAISDEPAKGELPPDKRAILQRNIFDPSKGPSPDGPEPAVAGAPSVCDESTRLVASFVSTRDPDLSIVSLSIGSDAPLLYRAGSVIDGKAIDSVYPESVVLERDGQRCSVTMFQPAKAPAPLPASKGSRGDEIERGIRRQSDAKYQVERAVVDRLLSNPAKLSQGVRVVPQQQHGQAVGAKLYGIQRGSLLGKLGIQNGDTLRTINGFDMSSPDSALEAYVKLRGASQLSVALVRRGAPVTIEYQIVD